jgi:hypothetical protein
MIDVLVFSLTIARTRTVHARDTLAQTLRRDGALYFFVIALANLTNIAALWVSPDFNYKGWQLTHLMIDIPTSTAADLAVRGCQLPIRDDGLAALLEHTTSAAADVAVQVHVCAFELRRELWTLLRSLGLGSGEC